MWPFHDAPKTSALPTRAIVKADLVLQEMRAQSYTLHEALELSRHIQTVVSEAASRQINQHMHEAPIALELSIPTTQGR